MRIKPYLIRNLQFLAVLFLPASALAGAPIEADLAASYASSYAASVGGEDNAQVIIANTVAGSNQIQDQGGTGAHMRIVGFYQSANDVAGQTTTAGIVNWLSSNDSHLSDVVAYGSAVGADLVVYICNNSDSSSIAGVSQQPGMYSSLNPGAVWSAVFAHETGGHAYGRSHSNGVLSPKTIMLHNYCGGGAAPPYFYSNPHIWFNGVQLVGNSTNNCSMGSLINGGDNSSCSAQAVADRRTHIVVGPDLSDVVWHWSFTNAPGSAPAGTVNYDLVSGAQAIVRGNGAVYTGTALRIPGGTTGNVAMNSMSAYIDLPNDMISSQTNITIEIWATPLSAPNWARLCDFGRTTQSGDGLGAAGEYTGTPGTAAPGSTSSYDDIMLSSDIGTDITQQRFEAKYHGYATTLDAGLATVVNVQHHYVITFTDGAGAAGSAGGRWQWFRDGDPVAYLDVTNHLADLQDVNNWLGRSMWTGDNNANNDYAEVRISDVAMSRAQIVANYRLGPNYEPTATVTLTNSDAAGVASFNAAGQWSNGAAPTSGNSYETYDFLLGTPTTGSGYTFGGKSLELSGGSLSWQGTASSTIYINDLTLNGGTLRNSGSGTCTLGGNLTVTTNGAVINGVNGADTITANLSGSGPVTCLANTTTLAGNNSSFTGSIYVGNGMAGTLAIDSQARLGAGPAGFTAGGLDLNRGTLQTSTSFSLDNPNRGILLDVSGGTFNVASGTTLTVSSPISSPVTASSIAMGSLQKAGAGTLILNSPSNSFIGTLYVDSGSTVNNDGVVRVANGRVMSSAHSPIFINDNNAGRSTLQLDGASGNIVLPQAVSLNGRTSSSAAIENLDGTNTIAGGVTINTGGANYWIQSDSGLLNVAGLVTSAATGARTLTFQGTGDLSVPGVISDGSATMNVTKLGSGTLTLSGNNTYSGLTTVNAGTLRLQPSAATLHLTFDNSAGSTDGTVITNKGAGGATLNGVLVGKGATIVSGGRYGNALSINGVGGTGATNIVKISNEVLPTDASASWTVGFWIKTTTAGAVILYQGDGAWSSSGQTTYLLNSDSGSTAGTKAGAVRWAGGFLTGTTALDNGLWHFITLVDDAGVESIYVDGNPDTVASTMGLALATDANQIWIGGAPDTDSGAVKMNGLIDEVYMFNRALSQAEVQALVNSNNASSYTSPLLPVNTTVSLAAAGTLDLGGVSQSIAGLSGAGVVTNSAGMASSLIISNTSGTSTFSGSINDASAANAISFVQLGGTTNVLSGANQFHGTTSLQGGELFVDGSLGSGPVTVASGVLSGSGVIGGPVVVQAGGTLAPGAGVRALTINNSLILQGTTAMELNKTAGTNDAVLGLSSVTYGGTLVVSNLAGTLQGGDAFKLFSARASAGNFANIVGSPGLNLDWHFDPASGVLAIYSTMPTNLMWNLAGGSLTLSWPQDHTGWRLERQTNNLAGGLSINSNDWMTVAGAQATNVMHLPVDPNAPGGYYRLVYP